MARLPKVGDDKGTWGDILNDFLTQSHADDGTLKANTVGAPQLRPGSVTNAAIADGQVSQAKLQGAGAANGIATLDGNGTLPETQVPGRLSDSALSAREVEWIEDPQSGPGQALRTTIDASVAAGVAPKANTSDVAPRNLSGTDQVTAMRSRALLNAPYSRPSVVNRKNLKRIEDALKTKTNPIITCLGNSISWGVGTNDASATSTGFQEDYRQAAWPVLLRKRIAQTRGVQPRENFVLLDGYAGYATLGGSAGMSQTIGPFGGYGSITGDTTRNGGVSLPDSTATVAIPSSKTGRFTEIDVLYWGTASGVSGGFSPNILIDGAAAFTGGTAFTGNIGVATVTGLSNAGHSVTIAGTGSNPTWIIGVVLRGPGEVVVNRVAAPGIDAAQVLGQSAWTTQQRTRQADAAVLAGYSDLVIISLTANEFYHQLDLATYTSSVTTLVNRAVGAGACVLLMGDPAASGEETGTGIKGSQYRNALIGISNANSNVAYADFNALFGERDVAQAAGMWSANGSVHPSREGHRRMADFIYEWVLPGATI